MRYLVLGGKKYPTSHIFDDVSLGRLRRIARGTGLSLLDIQQGAENLQGVEVEALLRDADALDRLAAFVWLVRTEAGDDITLDEAADFDISKLEFEGEDDDAEVESVADPTQPPAPTGSGPVEAAAVAAAQSTQRLPNGGSKPPRVTSKKK